jgi:nucleotide-binding universal stress UspA family protein
MISKIIIPTDFSEPASDALKYAIALGQKINAELVIAHINQVAMVDSSMPPETYQLFINEIEEATQTGFAKLEEKYLAASGLEYKMETRYGFVAEDICAIASENNCDLIIMGTTGASGAAELLFGSNAASVVGKSTLPVLVIPAGLQFNDYKHMVYATDYNEPEFPSMNRLIYFAELFDCPLDIIHVKSDSDRFFNADNNFFKKNKSKITYPNIKFIELEKGDVTQSINHYVEETHSDLLVMAKHNRNFFDRLFHRSLSKKMAFHTKIPLLVLVKD